jgi:hypothetical protein
MIEKLEVLALQMNHLRNMLGVAEKMAESLMCGANVPIDSLHSLLVGLVEVTQNRENDVELLLQGMMCNE